MRERKTTITMIIESCIACHDLGWIVASRDGDPRRLVIERCDICELFSDDASAQENAQDMLFPPPAPIDDNREHYIVLVSEWNHYSPTSDYFTYYSFRSAMQGLERLILSSTQLERREDNVQRYFHYTQVKPGTEEDEEGT